MNFSTLSTDELSLALKAIQRDLSDSSDSDSVQELLENLQVHRIELEMQNRALQETQAELEAAVQRYTDLYDHLPIGHVTLSPAGQIFHANSTAARWLGCEKSKLAGMYINWFLDAFDAGRFAAHLDVCVQTKQEQVCEVTLRLKDGSLPTVQLTSRVAAERPDEPLRIHTAITDLCKVAQARALLGDQEREQEALLRLVSGGAGDPAATVSALAHSLLHEHRTALPPGAVKIAERMERAAVRMETLVRHLIDYCSLGQDGMPLDPVNLEELVQQVVLEHRTCIQQRQAVVDIARPLPCVRGSRLILAQVLGNLLMNALRSPESQRPLHIRIAAEERPDGVILTIADDGLALPQDAEAFRVFERLHGCRHFLADGMGFKLVRRAIELMNGRVWLETRNDGRCCFNVGLQRV